MIVVKYNIQTCVSICIILSTLSYDTIFAQLPRKLHCLDQTSTECYIVNTFLSKNNSNFRPVSANPMNVVALKFESSVIPRISREICNAFPNLRTFNAEKSMVEEVDEDSFAECVNLDFIDFGQNKISRLGKNTFNRNTALQTLSLHDNNLATLDVDLFQSLPHLRRLVLSMNDLSEVPVVLFRDLANLGELTLHHNRLTDLGAEQLVKYCPKLSMIHVRDNDFRCERLGVILNVLTKANVNFWDYADKLRPRNYTVEFINRMECLNDVQFDMEMQIRKNLTRTIFEMEKELNVLKEEVAEVKKEEKGSNHIFGILIGCAVLVVIGAAIGYFVARRRRIQVSPMERLNDRMDIIGTDFSHN